MFSLICTWTNGCINNRQADDLTRHCAQYYVTLMATFVGIMHRKGRLKKYGDFLVRIIYMMHAKSITSSCFCVMYFLAYILKYIILATILIHPLECMYYVYRCDYSVWIKVTCQTLVCDLYTLANNHSVLWLFTLFNIHYKELIKKSMYLVWFYDWINDVINIRWQLV